MLEKPPLTKSNILQVHIFNFSLALKTEHTTRLNSRIVFFRRKVSQFALDIFRLQLFDPLDEVVLLDAAVAHLVPVTQDLPQVADLQLFQVDSLDVDAFV